VEDWDPAAIDLMQQQMADALGVDSQHLAHAWNATAQQRRLGLFPDLASYIIHVCDRIGCTPSPDALEASVRIRLERTSKQLVARPDAMDTLTELHRRGLGIGLISNCTPEVPALWRDTSLAPLLDTMVFSSEVHLLKPDATIYRQACAHLGVQPGRCLYVGDGDSDELTGAASVGMQPVLIPMRYDKDGANAFRFNERIWKGPRIRTLNEVLGLVCS
jgi:putative hydrolase of the HAD superfamily